jgi:hypothetical protein
MLTAGAFESLFISHIRTYFAKSIRTEVIWLSPVYIARKTTCDQYLVLTEYWAPVESIEYVY